MSTGSLPHSIDAAIGTHEGGADPHTGYVKESDANWIDLTDTGATTLHSHAGGGAPTTADYLVGTADAGLSAEIVVGTSPGGELGGTWASPTVDATHSGSTHAATQAAAEATAAAALTAHAGAADPHAVYQLESGLPLAAWPIGSVFISVVSTNPNTLLGGGTWAAIATGRVLVGIDGADADFDTVEETGGAKTVSAVVGAHDALTNNHAGVTVADHSALTNNHSGGGVDAHAVTQPTAHGTLTHSTAADSNTSGGTAKAVATTHTLTNNHSGTAVGNHVFTQPSAHGAISAHSVGQPSAHGAISAHSVTASSVVQPYFVVYMWKRTA